ncbi:hypothetical protein N9766_01430 [Flavobacteriaceae bacterium]|nr:hypothetical protein [Flavobacteriaceae bacterium]
MKIALIKQDTYQDLYVGDKSFSPEELLSSSIMRVGPIGLFTLCDADFYIIKEDIKNKECTTWQKVLKVDPNILRSLKDKPFKESLLYKTIGSFKEPGSQKSHSDFSLNYNSIDWNEYDVVISINISIPTKYIKKFKNTLWCYMIGEANIYSDKVYFDYDICLNQENRGYTKPKNGIIDFPYTFIGPNCLNDLFKGIDQSVNRKKIFLEINNVTERPFKIDSTLRRLEETGLQISTHKQLINENILELISSKYFVKIQGRIIRGNGLYEAISSGSLVLSNPDLIIHTQVLPKECWVYDIDSLITKINYLERNPKEYNNLLNLQKSLVKHFVVDCPLKSLEYALNQKRNSKVVSKASIITRILRKLNRIMK